MSVPSSEKGGGATLAGGGNSDDWREGLALCLLCDKGNMKDFLALSPSYECTVHFTNVHSNLEISSFIP